MAAYRRVTYADRCQIQAFLQVKLSVDEISQKLKFHRSTIFREISRNRYLSIYEAQRAEKRKVKRFSRCRRPRMLLGESQIQVEAQLISGLSPQQISRRFALEQVMQISHQTIYNHVRRNSEWLKPTLRRFNRRGGSRVRMAAHRTEGKISIDDRPDACNRRLRFGDWERDSMYVAKRRQILVCVDRKSRFTKIRRSISQKVSDVTRLTNQLLKETRRKVYSITNDNGPEFRKPDGLIAPVFYCHPRKPQQRGTVENTIGLLRQYIKRTTDINTLTDEDLEAIENSLNLRPRKCLDYKTPYEVFYGKTVALAL